MSRLLAPGGWVGTWTFAAQASLDDPHCAFCRRTVEVGWCHATTLSLVCSTCLPDPNADDGEAGLQAAVRLRRRLDLERERDLGVVERVDVSHGRQEDESIDESKLIG